ncbi:MAG: DUF6122 family protein [Anaerolineae bacterium]|nr:DUF6122 family protein [Anaerolineae bacterium]
MLASLLHIALHLLVPGVVAWFIFRPRWQAAWLVMLLTMAVDLDHLLADPIFDPNRCSLGFHPLHSPLAVTAYLALLAFSQTRLVGLGLLIHMALDGLDCLRIL